ncbi:ATP-binding protein [Sneathiella aquimaris]|uniref:ATP-binding protein n=1 Tax=Sneathiella aquimaris TaxID=2599305 RepID=UPI00146B7C64|nr:ATP-binding protein [Sneathiella aquimaris]
MIVGLVKEVTLLLTLALIHKYIIRELQDRSNLILPALGLLFGLISIIGMMVPFEVAPGIFFDGRTIILALSGLFGGYIGGTIAMVMAGGYRLWLGGDGAMVGVLSIIIATGCGCALRVYVHGKTEKVTVWMLLGLGFVVHLGLISLFPLLHAESFENIIADLSIAILIVYPPSVAFLGLLFLDNYRRLEVERELTSKQAVIDAHSIFSETNANGIITKTNPLFCEISGYTKEELVGQDHRILNSKVHPPEFFEDMWRTISRGDIWKGDICNRSKNGNIYWVKSTIVPVLDQDGKIARFVSMRTDITEDQLSQQQLRHANLRAKEANQAKLMFLASMSHELRTPLNAIIGFSDMMRKRIWGPMDNKHYESYVEDIYQSGESLLSMVNDVLDISKYEATGYQFSLENYDVVEHSARIARRFENMNDNKEIKITVEKGPDFPNCIYSDKTILTQILNNLISNALRFVPNENGWINIHWNVTDNKEIILTVTDNGPGIPEEVLKRIGEPFILQNTDYTAKNKTSGTGLGLYICKSLIETRGGKLEIESSKNNGTCAKIRIPLTLCQSSSQQIYENLESVAS